LIFDQISNEVYQINESSLTLTVKKALVEKLRDEIIRGDLIPGQHLRLEEIASRLEVTRLSTENLQDIYDIRTILEEMATRLSVPNLTNDTITQLGVIIDQMDNHLGELVTLVNLNHNFHNTLYAASGRRHLCELTSLLRRRTQHYLHAFITDLGGMPRAQVEHRAILEACRTGDAEEAAHIMHEHVMKVGQSIIEYVQRTEKTKQT